MVHGVKEYWAEESLEKTHRRSIGALLILVIFLILVFILVAYMLIFHPATEFEIEPVSREGSDYIVMTATNRGGLKEEFLDITVNINPVSECRLSYSKNGCEDLFNNKLFCNYLEPGDHVTIECPFTENGTSFKMSMRSKYQSTNLEYSCSPEECHEIVSHLSGSFPVLWNYLLAYPADRMVDFYNGVKEWLWPEQGNQTGQ